MIVPEDAHTIRTVLADILSQKQFAGLKEPDRSNLMEMLDRFLKNSAFGRSIARFMNAMLDAVTGFFSAGNVPARIILSLLFLFIIWFALRAVRRNILKGIKTPVDGSAGAVSDSVPDMEKQAMSAGDRGDFVTGIRMLYMAFLKLLDSRDIAEYRGSLTNREWEALIFSLPSPDLQRNFARLNSIFEEKVYGLVPCTRAEFDDFTHVFGHCRRGVDRIEG